MDWKVGVTSWPRRKGSRVCALPTERVISKAGQRSQRINHYRTTRVRSIFSRMRTKRLLSCLLLLGVLPVLAVAQGDPLPDEKGVVAEAQKKLAADPKNVKLILELANAQAAVWRMDDAIATYSEGLKLAP